jgi:subtilisin family serine protease
MTYSYFANGQKIELNLDPTVVAVRFRAPAPLSVRRSVIERSGVSSFRSRLEVPGEPFTIVAVPAGPTGFNSLNMKARFDETTAVLNAADEVDRVAPVFKMGANRVVTTDRLLVGLRGAPADPVAWFREHGATIVEDRGDGEYLVRLAVDADPFAVAAVLHGLPEVLYAEPDFVTIGSHLPRRAVPVGPAPAQPTPGDPLLARQYAVALTQADQAWTVQRGNPGIKIAILDEGVDTEHEDLKAAIVGGYDATDRDNDQEPRPWDGHGTACAGLAAAIHGNGRGIQGIGGGCSLLAVRIAYSKVRGGAWVITNSDICAAIDWASTKGADVLSNSWGGGAPSSAVALAFEKARTKGRGGKGCVVVIAAGNDNRQLGFPADLPGLLVVSASNEYDEPKTPSSRDGEYWWGSSYGAEVCVAAPGVHNYTTDITGDGGEVAGAQPDSNYMPDFNGTSSATPIVAGACGLILSVNPQLTEAEVRKIIQESADKVGGDYLNGKNLRMGYGRLNVLRAVQVARARIA